MKYGEIVKKAWGITWRYRALWVLGMFAGITGWSAAGGSSGSGGSSSTSASSTGLSDLPQTDWQDLLQRALPVIFVVVGVLLIISLVWWLLSLVARASLIHAVNETEEGRPVVLGAAWRVGSDRLWRVLGLSVVLNLPLALGGLILAAVILVPIAVPLLRGAEPSSMIVAPICGALAIGVPVLLIASFVLGILYVIALRFVTLSDLRVGAAIREAWKAFRARIKNHSLMWLINWGLNFAAGIALSILFVVLALVLVVPIVIAAIGQNWNVLVLLICVLVVLLVVVSLFYTAIWGTFTSALWTVFFRRLTGLEPEAPQAVYPVAGASDSQEWWSKPPAPMGPPVD
ncbi:MAG: hypothetical protein HGA39_01680 [Coriobacteriia bacterium]|nr:hypothetical protein [Coriobacteriia bacterium]